jgi:hypothetical protein
MQVFEWLVAPECAEGTLSLCHKMREDRVKSQPVTFGDVIVIDATIGE